MDLKEKAKNLPLSPGVYFMKDSLGNIIYVGKSKLLRNRVLSYFQNSKAHSKKVQKLVKNLKDFDYITTDTEFEAFMLECKCIKELKPTYNKLMKNPLSYTFIEINQNNTSYLKEAWSSIKVTNVIRENCNSLYFGPFTNKSTVEKAVEGINECFKITCTNPSAKNTSCLNYSLGKCIGMCLGDDKIEQCSTIINKVIALFNGVDNFILEKMEEKMILASENFDFEKAARYRDYINAIKSLINKEKVIEFTKTNKYIVMVEYLNEFTIKVFLLKRNQVLFSQKYNLEDTDINDIILFIDSNIISHFKKHISSATKLIGKNEIDEAEIIYSYLKNRKCNYATVSQNLLKEDTQYSIDTALNNLLRSVTFCHHN